MPKFGQILRTKYIIDVWECPKIRFWISVNISSVKIFTSKFKIMLGINREWKYSLRRALTLSWWRSLSYRNKSIDLLCKSMDWFLYDRDLRHERVNDLVIIFTEKLHHRYYFYREAPSEMLDSVLNTFLTPALSVGNFRIGFTWIVNCSSLNSVIRLKVRS